MKSSQGIQPLLYYAVCLYTCMIVASIVQCALSSNCSVFCFLIFPSACGSTVEAWLRQMGVSATLHLVFVMQFSKVFL